MGHSRPLFSFLAFQQLTVNIFIIKLCQWLDSNCKPLCKLSHNHCLSENYSWSWSANLISDENDQSRNFFFKNGPIPASFCLFSFFSHSNSNDKYTIWTIKIEKRGWWAWDSNPGRHDGRHRQIHWAIAAPAIISFMSQRWLWFGWDRSAQIYLHVSIIGPNRSLA